MVNFQNKNIFITGVNGFLGSWLAMALVDLKANVTGLIRDWIPGSNLIFSGFNKKISIVRGGVEDYKIIERALNEYEIDIVFHLAAQAIVGSANKSPLATFESNIKGTWNVLEACRNNKVSRIVVASSDKAYGIHAKLPYTEDFALNGRFPYDASKSCTDILAQTYFQTYGMPIGVTRCSNIYGGGDLNFSRIVPGTIKSLIFNESPIIRSDGTFKRDYIYVKDVVNAYLILAQKLENKKMYGEAFNFGTEKPISVIDVVNKIIKISAKKMKPTILNQAKGEIKDQWLSSKKAEKILGWKPKFSLDQGLKESYEWYREYFGKTKS